MTSRVPGGTEAGTETLRTPPAPKTLVLETLPPLARPPSPLLPPLASLPKMRVLAHAAELTITKAQQNTQNPRALSMSDLQDAFSREMGTTTAARTMTARCVPGGYLGDWL